MSAIQELKAWFSKNAQRKVYPSFLECQAEVRKWADQEDKERALEQVLAHGHLEAVKWILTDKVQPGYNFSNGAHGTLVWIPS